MTSVGLMAIVTLSETVLLYWLERVGEATGCGYEDGFTNNYLAPKSRSDLSAPGFKTPLQARAAAVERLSTLVLSSASWIPKTKFSVVEKSIHLSVIETP